MDFWFSEIGIISLNGKAVFKLQGIQSGFVVPLRGITNL
jgi:hypothetical protein